MSLLTVPNTWGWHVNNWNGTTTYPAASVVGQAITLAADASLAGATAVQVSSGLANAAHVVKFCVAHPRSSGADRSAIMSLGYDAAGGTSYTWVVDNVLTPPTVTASPVTDIPQFIVLPLHIPAGASVAIRAATVHTSDVTGAYAIFEAYGLPSRPELTPSFGKCETLGYTSGVVGTVVQCQANPNGRVPSSTWTSIGTTTFPWQAHSVGINCSGATVTAETYWLEIGYGDGSTITTISIWQLSFTASEAGYRHPVDAQQIGAVPSGATLYARIRSSAASPGNQGAISIVIVGVG